MRQPVTISLIAIAAALGAWLLCGETRAAPTKVRPAAQPAQRSPVAQGPEADLNLVFTAQVVGWVVPCG